MQFSDYQPPLVAILRGLTVEDAPWVGEVLYKAGFRILEVPLNRPGAVQAIEALVRAGHRGMLVGGGTMLTLADVESVFAAGGRLMVAPNCNPDVIRHAAALGMLCAPGVATPSEAFRAIDAGAHILKLFPADAIGEKAVVALRSTLPEGIPILPVGGITPDVLAAWKQAGASGFGIGGALYRPGISRAELESKAQQFLSAWASAAKAASAPANDAG